MGGVGLSYIALFIYLCKCHSEMSPIAQSRNVTTGANGSAACQSVDLTHRSSGWLRGLLGQRVFGRNMRPSSRDDQASGVLFSGTRSWRLQV